MVGYVPGNGFLHRAHPFTAMAIGGGAAVLAFLIAPPAGPLAVLALVVALAVTAGVWRVLIPAAVISGPFWVFLFVIHGVFREAPLTALGLSARITASIVAFLLVIAVVHPGRLVEALLARGVPFAAAYLLAAAIQIVPRFRDRARAILDAQRCRGLRLRGSPLRRVRAVVALAIPLVLSALAEVDEHALALETRGVGAGKRRTTLHAPADTRFDRAIRWGVLAALVVALWLSFR